MALSFAPVLPTLRCVLLLLLCAPVALVIAALSPGAWVVAPLLGHVLADTAA